MNKFFSPNIGNHQGYLKWKEQLEALKQGDYNIVKRIGDEAKAHLEFKRRGRLQLSFAKN